MQRSEAVGGSEDGALGAAVLLLGAVVLALGAAGSELGAGPPVAGVLHPTTQSAPAARMMRKAMPVSYNHEREHDHGRPRSDRTEVDCASDSFTVRCSLAHDGGGCLRRSR